MKPFLLARRLAGFSRLVRLAPFVGALCLPTFAADLHVATDGVDADGRGSLALPYRTIDYAADRANPGDTVYIRGGTYREIITPARSGAAGSPITFKPYGNEAVTITGLRLVVPGAGGVGQWVAEGNGIYRLQLTSSQAELFTADRAAGSQVFIDGQPLQIARWPNASGLMNFRRADSAKTTGGSWNAGAFVANGTAYTSTVTVEGLDAFQTDVWKGGFALIAPGAGWNTRIVAVDANSAGGFTYTFKPYASDQAALTRNAPAVGDPVILLGRKAALDAPGEYYFDANGLDGPANTLYLRLPEDANPAGKTLEIRRDRQLLQLGHVSHLRFENLRFLAAAIQTIMPSAPNPGTTDCTFQGLEVIWPNYIWREETAFFGVNLRGARNRLLDSRVSYSVDAAVNVEGDGHEIRNTVIHHSLYTTLQLRRSSSNILVERVTVFEAGSGAIGANASPSRVLLSHGSYSGQHSTDVSVLGAVGAYDSRGSEWAYNWMHDNQSVYTPFGVRNPQWNGGPAIRLDSDPSNFLIHHNLAWASSQPEDIAIWALKSSAPNYNDAKIRIYNNTVAKNIRITESGGTPSALGIDLRNNLAGGRLDVRASLPITQLVLFNNLFAQTPIADNPTPPHLANRSGSPGLINAAQPPFGFALSSSSQAINQGVVIPGITDNYVGVAPDIGALESGRPLFVPGAQVRASDLEGLRVSVLRTSTSTRFRVSGLPLGRSLPATFKLKIGNATASTSFQHEFDFVNHTVTALVVAPFFTGSAQPVQFSLDGVNYVATGVTVDIPAGGRAATNVPATNSLVSLSDAPSAGRSPAGEAAPREALVVGTLLKQTYAAK